MTKTKTRVRRNTADQELDSVFFLKLVLYLILGSQWLRITDDAGTVLAPLPLGLIIGVIFAMHDHFKIDRRIEFAVLLVAMFVGFWTQSGIYFRV